MPIPIARTARVYAHQVDQTIDGFGVNINSKSWEPRLLPAMELLLDDLKASLFRVDIFGKSNWIDPSGVLGPASLAPDHLASIYQDAVARRGWEMIRFLNERGIAPYLTASGDVPAWMLAPDGKTLADGQSFAEMLASLLDWAVNREGLRIAQFGPLNETDIGSPEGPTVLAEDYPRVLETIQAALAGRGLSVPLVVPEQAHFSPRYIQEITKHASLSPAVYAFSTHCYTDLTPSQYAEVRAAAAVFPQAHLWMGEFGDLEQSGEQEWTVAWRVTSRLFDMLESGYQAALVWDAYDNYHDHDEHWTIYGILRTGLRAYTPKKRYHALRQVFRFVRPGYQRVAVSTNAQEARLLAFASPDRSQLVIVGMNAAAFPLQINMDLEGFSEALMAGRVTYWRTSEQENGCRVAEIPVRGSNWPYTGIDVTVPPECIFTLST